MRVSVELKAKLQELADGQYRTLTDFIEIELRRMLDGPKTRRQSRIQR